ncbi:unnamed protein product [Vicia faba]|uniref:DUF4228 domain protein n=1 Tax=Vicia faba TaxID=3906 RepID=A0AAV1APC3_VICFA|nr:unnamed protein product [Vicia faba]
MGACYSCNTSSILKNIIRVVHLNGFVEDFDQPISASQVIGNPPKHFVCTSIQLLSSSYKPLKGDNSQLQPGQLYFMLPYSVLQADVSPVDLACLAKRLTAKGKAKNKPSDYNKSSKAVIPLPSRSPCRVGVEEKVMINGGRGPCRMQSWKPILESIAEKSLNRRSESDLQENCIVDLYVYNDFELGSHNIFYNCCI